MCGCQGACMVAGGCVWGEACVVAGGHAWLWGACVVAGGCAWLPGGAWLWGDCLGYDGIRSMSGRYASYWNAFLYSSCNIFVVFPDDFETIKKSLL